jgi:hypothetical protein
MCPPKQTKKKLHKKFDKLKSLSYLCGVFKKDLVKTNFFKVKKKFTKMFDKLKSLSYLCRPIKKGITSVLNFSYLSQIEN